MPLPCPDCLAPLPEPAGTACGRCGLPLVGAPAARLYEVDLQLAALGEERTRLLAVLRAARDRVPVPAGGLPAAPAPGRPARSPQAALLGLGALLLLVATSVFLAVVWVLIGVVGQVVLLAGLTAGAGAGSVETARRGLTSTATALAWLAAGLTVVGVQAGRTLGLPGLVDLSGPTTAGAGALLGTVLAAAAARGSGQPVFAVQAVVSSGLVLPALLLAGDVGIDPAPQVVALGGWGVAALVVARRAPAVLHPATAAAVRGTATAAGLLAVAVAVVGGAVAATGLPGRPGLEVAVPVLVLTALCLLAAVRVEDEPAAVPVVAGATGLAVLLVLVRGAEAASASAPWTAATAGVLGWLGAAALVLRGASRPALGAVSVRPGALATGLAAGPAALGAAALLAALLRDDHVRVAVLCAGLAAGAGAVAAGLRHETPSAWFALPLTVGAAGGAVLAGLTAGGAGVLPRTVALAALAVVAAGLAAWWQEEPAEPGLGVVAGLGLVGALSLAPRLADPVLAVGLLLGGGAVVALAYACLPRRGWASPFGVALAAGSSWTLLADRGVDVVEVYTLPIAALLLVAGLVRLSREPEAPSWTSVGPAVALALVPSAQVAAADPASVRSLLVPAAAVAVVLLGTRTHLRALVVTGGLVVAETVVVQLGQAALYLPRWLVLATLGALLLGAGATYERRVQQARAAGAWVRALR